MKRIFSLMAVCLLALGLAACGSSPASSGEPKDYVTIPVSYTHLTLPTT